MIKSTTTKTITLAGGATVRIRKLSARDFLELGDFPDVLADAQSGKANKVDPKVREFSLKLAEIILLQCTGPIKDGETQLKIVKKPFAECSDSEISLEEFSSSEQSAQIISEVTEFSGLGKAAQDAARPFPQEQAGNGDAVQPLSVVQNSSERVA